MIEVEGLTKRYGTTVAVDDLTMTVRPGGVTGFLGPNGAGKSTTMRMVLGLTHPTSGRALVNGRPYRQLPNPAHTVGALLDAHAVQPFRTGAEHLRWLARAGRIPDREVAEKIALVSLAHAADRRVGGYSLGMRQRLGLAAALLGDPAILILDEPTNGLDPDGIVWLRSLLRTLADEGRTVFVSSHLMGEMELTADRVLIINRGRFIEDVTISELTEHTARDAVFVLVADPAPFAEFLRARHATVEGGARGLLVRGLPAPAIGQLALQAGVALHELRSERRTLEEAFMQVTGHDGTGNTPSGFPGAPSRPRKQR